MALQRDRDTAERALFGTKVSKVSYPATNAVILFVGALAVLDASGEMKPGVTGTGLTALGRVTKYVDNTGDGKLGEAQPGVFRWDNSGGGDTIAAADRGKVCYIVDDATVAKTDGTGTRSVAGIVQDVDADGVWVATGFNIFAQPAAQAGAFLLQKEVTVPYNHASFAATADGVDVNINVGTALPAGAIIVASRYTIGSPFAGVGVATLTMKVGTAGVTDGVVQAIDIFGDAAAEYRGVPGTLMNGPAGGAQLIANFDPDNGAGLDELTGGSVTIEVFYFVAS